MDKALRNTIIAGIIIIAISVSYYLVIFLPKKEAARIEMQKKEQEMKSEQQRQGMEEEKQAQEKQKQEQEANLLKEQGQSEEEKQIRQTCYDEAAEKARVLLKKKSDLKFAEAESEKKNNPDNIYAGVLDLEEAERLKEMVNKNMFLTNDYDRYYENCLSINGLEK